MINKSCKYSNIALLMGIYFISLFFLSGQVPTIISVAMNIFVHVSLHKLVWVPKNSKRILILIDVAQLFSKKTGISHTSTSNKRRFSLSPSFSAFEVIILLTFCLSKVQNTISYCYLNLLFPKIINLSIVSCAVGQLDFSSVNRPFKIFAYFS